MIEGKWLKPGEDLSAILPIRMQALHAGADGLDSAAWNAVIYSQGQPGATGRIWWAEGAFWIGSVCVKEGLRGQGLGDLTVRLLLFKAQQHGASLIRLVCPENLVPFFARYGFAAEDRAPGQGLASMRLPASEICLDACSHCRPAPSK